MKLSDPIEEVNGIGAVLARKFNALGIFSVEELLTYYPRRYDDFSNITPLSQVKPGMVTIKAKLTSVVKRRSQHGLHVTEALASDATGSVHVIWFNQPYRAAAIDKNSVYFISGEYGLSRQRMTMINPSVELASKFPLNTARIVPVYRETKDLKSFRIRRVIKASLPYLKLVKESLPQWILDEYQLIPLAQAIETMHFPLSQQELASARFRIGFEEVFDLALSALISKNELLQNKAPSINFDQALAVSFVKNLPFKLTDEQRQVTWRILQDMQRDVPMNRLVEGDVGTGKTVVATMARSNGC